MTAQVLILSADAVFARMLEIELEMMQIRVARMRAPRAESRADLVLLDLDTSLPPNPEHYRYMIGFTQNSASAGEETGRKCSLVLRRPFEMRLLREEVSTLLFSGEGDALEQEGKNTSEDYLLEHLSVRLSDGRSIPLSPKEYAVMALLLSRRGTPVSREEIAETIGESTANKVDVYVCFLRRKLETPERRVIMTVRGKGYQLIERKQL